MPRTIQRKLFQRGHFSTPANDGASFLDPEIPKLAAGKLITWEEQECLSVD